MRNPWEVASRAPAAVVAYRHAPSSFVNAASGDVRGSWAAKP